MGVLEDKNEPTQDERVRLHQLTAIATHKAYSCMEAEQIQPESDRSFAHDAYPTVTSGAINPGIMARSATAG